MHQSSRLKFECFVDAYMRDGTGREGRSVLDVGSRQVSAAAYSYRQALDGLGIAYTGLDLEQGINVDIVPANPFIWDEIGDETFDFVISGQAFEHNPFMWITTAEIARVLKPGGIAFIIAPSAGNVHRFPYDCWRYYPDSWAALAAVTQLELAESIREPERLAAVVNGGRWKDSAAILRKPALADKAVRADFYANLALIVAPFKARRYEVVPAVLNAGPCFERYEILAMASEAAAAAEPAGEAPPKLGPARERLRAARRRDRQAGPG